MQQALMNMVAEPKLVHCVDDHIVAFYEKALRLFPEATRGKVHAVLIGDGVDGQEPLPFGSPADVAAKVREPRATFPAGRSYPRGALDR